MTAQAETRTLRTFLGKGDDLDNRRLGSATHPLSTGGTMTGVKSADGEPDKSDGVTWMAWATNQLRKVAITHKCRRIEDMTRIIAECIAIAQADGRQFDLPHMKDLVAREVDATHERNEMMSKQQSLPDNKPTPSKSPFSTPPAKIEKYTGPATPATPVPAAEAERAAAVDAVLGVDEPTPAPEPEPEPKIPTLRELWGEKMLKEYGKHGAAIEFAKAVSYKNWADAQTRGTLSDIEIAEALEKHIAANPGKHDEPEPVIEAEIVTEKPAPVTSVYQVNPAPVATPDPLPATTLAPTPVEAPSAPPAAIVAPAPVALVVAPRKPRQVAPALPERERWNIMREQADILIKSGFLPTTVRTPEQAIAIMMMSEAIGVMPIIGLQSINVIQGKPTVSPQLMLALINRSGQLEDLQILDDGLGCSVVMKRVGRSAYTAHFDMDDAKKMGLAGKDNWNKQPATMRQWRAVSAACRVVFPDIIMGMYLTEELDPDKPFVEAA